MTDELLELFFCTLGGMGEDCVTMERLANHIIAVAKENDIPITNLQLQKVMYFTIKIAKDEDLIPEDRLRELYDQPFEVWQYGPVVRSQYERFKGYASEPIIGKYRKMHILEPLDNLILDLLNENVFRLVKLSHRIPFWENHRDEIIGFRSSVAYSFEDI